MYACIASLGLEKSQRSCPRRVSAVSVSVSAQDGIVVHCKAHTRSAPSMQVAEPHTVCTTSEDGHSQPVRWLDSHPHKYLINIVSAMVLVKVGWFAGCLTSQQHASVSQGQICEDNFSCCHTEIEVADQTFRLTQSQYTDTGPTSPSTDPTTPGARQVASGVPIF